MEPERLSRIWQEAERARDRASIDLPLLVGVAATLGPVTWRDAAELALHERGDETRRPLPFLELIAASVKALRPASILDPWVATPTILTAAHDASKSARSCGLVPDDRLWDVAKCIARLDWRCGDPFLLLHDLADERFDLVLATPPAGMRGAVNREPGDPGGRVDCADLVLWRAVPLVTEGGHVLFHTMDNFLWSKTRRRLWPELAERGLHPHAVVSIDQALAPGWIAATSLVLFGSHAPDQLFVARVERDTSIPALVENLVAHRAADDPHLGVLTTAHDFRGWGRFIVERNLARMFESSDMRAIADIGRVRRVQLKPGVPYDPPPNCLFVPTLGFGNVMTVPPDLEGKSGYTLVEVQLDPALARAEYVAGLLSSPPGKQLRESVATGSTVPNIKASGVSELRVPLPALAVQAQAVQTAAHLASMEAAIARAHSELWRRPEQAPRLLSQLEIETKDPVRRWLETLPYPLASVLQRYLALRDSTERLSRLLHFYEITAEFACAVLMSILRNDPETHGLGTP